MKVLPCGVLFLLLLAPAQASESECREIASHFAQAPQGMDARKLNGFLFEAAGNGCATLVGTLLDAGASVAVRRREGDTVLHHAARAGETEIVALLLDRGAEIDRRDLQGSTAL